MFCRFHGVPSIAILALSLLVGCGTAKTVPVNGKVQFKDGKDGSSLAGYVISLESTEQNVSGSGEVQADGTFRISTYGDNDGAVPGKHRVAITPPLPLPDAVPPAPLIDKKYDSLDTSGLEVDIQPGASEVTLEVEPLAS